MGLTQTDFPDLAGTVELAGRRWSFVVVGDYEYDTVTVSVTLMAGKTRHGPFEFYDGKLDRDDFPFSADCVVKTEEAVFQLIGQYWPLSF